MRPRRINRRSCSVSSRHEDSGAALVEFALVLPIFALMLFAMIQFGMTFTGWAQVRNDVQTAARAAATGSMSSVPSGSQCGQTDATQQTICEIALQIGSALDMAPTLAGCNSAQCLGPMQVPEDAGCQTSGTTLTNCQSYAWLDGSYIRENGTWEQIVSNLPWTGQVPDQQAFDDGISAAPSHWTCVASTDGDCTELDTGVTGVQQVALAEDEIALSCEDGAGDPSSSCVSGGRLKVCTQLTATAITGFLPSLSLSTDSSFYIDDQTIDLQSTPSQGVSCE